MMFTTINGGKPVSIILLLQTFLFFANAESSLQVDSVEYRFAAIKYDGEALEKIALFIKEYRANLLARKIAADLSLQ